MNTGKKLRTNGQATAKRERIDLGLAISGLTMRPGETRTSREIAAFCACSWQAIDQIERKAMRKIRDKLFFGEFRGMITPDDFRERPEKTNNHACFP